MRYTEGVYKRKRKGKIVYDGVLAYYCERVVEVAQREGRTKVGCIILGRGSDEHNVLSWIQTAAQVPGFIGFAVGRTTWWNAMAAWRGKEISSAAAIVQIAKHFREWVDVFEQTSALKRYQV